MSTRSAALFAAACAAAAAVTVAGCSASSPPIPTTSGNAPSTHASGHGHKGHSKPAHYPTTRRALSALVSRAVAKASTVHVTYHELAGQNVVDLVGDEQLLRGQVADAAFTETTSSSSQSTKIIIKDQVLYVQLPEDAHTPRPWLKADQHSTNARIRSLYGTLQAVNASGPANVTQFLAATTSFTRAGTGTSGHVPVAKYVLTVSVAKLPKSYPLKSALETEGVPSFTLQLSVDAAGRPYELDENIDFNGQVITSQVGLSRYDAHVRVAAPASRLVRTA